MQDGRSENEPLNAQDEIITAQYDSLMSLIPTQITHEETRIDVTIEDTRAEPTESKEEEGIAIEEIPIQADSDESLEKSPPQSEGSTQGETELASDRVSEEETTTGTLNSTTKIEDSPGSSEAPRSKDDEPFVDYSIITGNRSDVVNTLIWEKFQEVKAVQLPYSTRIEPSSKNGESCEGRYIYVYDLPSEFNSDLAARCDYLFPWISLCDFFVDSGRGVPVNAIESGAQIFVPGDRWFSTHQYALEMVSHARILKYKCLTEDPNLASLFYIPYYGGLDVIRWHFHENATNEKRDELALRLFRWLEQKPPWRRHGGRDHVLVLGKISWDFRRQADGMWGSRLLEFPEMQEATKVLIERDPWAGNDIGVPHPTYFHPQSAADIDTWLRHVRSQERTSLVTFVGKERKNDPTNVRSALVKQCRNVTSESDCRFVECDKDNCFKAAYVTKAFMATHFCMQPVGDSPTRRSVFDSLIAGCIPVLFHPCTAYVQYPWHLPENESTWSVYISEDEIRAGTASVVDTLKRISVAERDAMRENIITNVIPGLLYSAPGSDVSPYRDAFDITIDQLLYRVKHRPSSETS